jgi:hypothetical protein
VFGVVLADLIDGVPEGGRHLGQVCVGPLQLSLPPLLELLLVSVPLCCLWRLVSLGLDLVQLALLGVEGETEVKQLEAAVDAAPHHVARLEVGVYKVAGVEAIQGAKV